MDTEGGQPTSSNNSNVDPHGSSAYMVSIFRDDLTIPEDVHDVGFPLSALSTDATFGGADDDDGCSDDGVGGGVSHSVGGRRSWLVPVLLLHAGKKYFWWNCISL